LNILSEFRVIECATNIAGPYCGKLFVDAGAEVIKVEPAQGDPLRRRAVHGEELANRDAALFRFLNAGKSSLIGGPGDDVVDDLLGSADVLVEDFVPAQFDIDDLRRRFPALVIISITPYGRRGSWANRPANDFIVQAESGAIATRGDPDRPPYQVGGRLTEYIAGTYAAVGAIAAARESKRSGCGQWLDCASIESTNITFSVFTDLGAAIFGADVSGSPRRVREYPSIEPTLDGWVGFNTNTAQMWESLLLMIGRSDLIGDPEWAVFNRMPRGEEVTAMTRAYTTTKTTAELVAEASRLRIPVAAVGDGQSVLEHPQFRDRGFYVPSSDGDFTQPLPPYMINGERATPRGPAPQLGSHTEPSERQSPARSRPPARRPLEGLRVVDATGWWAGPSATQLLACLGAEVIHVESISRLDGARTAVWRGAFDESWYERSALWNGANTNKLDVTLALDHSKGIAAFKLLIKSADIVVENYSPRVFENFQLTWETIRDLNPRAIFVRMPAFGTTGPWRDYVGFAQTMEQLSGMAWLTGYPDGEPRIPLGPCDPNAGTHAVFALLVALVRRDRWGEGCCVEATMAEAALNAAAEQPIVYSAYGITMMRSGNRSPDAAPQGLYRCSDPGESWLALSVETDDQWTALRDVVGIPAWASDRQLDTHAGRRRNHDRIDSELSQWAIQRGVADAVEQLVAAGVPAGEVRDPRKMHHHPLLQERGYFVDLDHPVVGRQPVPCPPFRPVDDYGWMRSSAPLLGQDNWEVLRSIGMTDGEIQDLIDEKVVGTSP
jgi:crotonobetainyl-CoA:carnitine CoA-transferase CaiB-like acyl-CoA transferase